MDHSRTLDALFLAHLVQYGRDNQVDDDPRDALLAAYDRLIPNHASIVEVVTKPWNESTLSRPQALQKVREVFGDVEGLYREIAGGKAHSGRRRRRRTEEIAFHCERLERALRRRQARKVDRRR